jgi:hypothetical protein
MFKLLSLSPGSLPIPRFVIAQTLLYPLFVTIWNHVSSESHALLYLFVFLFSSEVRPLTMKFNRLAFQYEVGDLEEWSQ